MNNNFTIRNFAPDFVALTLLLAVAFHASAAEEGEEAVEREYAFTPPAPAGQTAEQAEAKSSGCMSCHTETDSRSMHASPAIQLGCTDCHGGNANVFVNVGASRESQGYQQVMERAHVLPRYPETWHFPHSANPERTYTLLNRESNEFIRFMNPSDFRVAGKACGACHQDIIEASTRSMHATGAMLWGGAAYNNGIL
ncbi:MAG: hypothetical protein OEM63_11670, partial [Gammaproteobacteria bacterium]|nr:hypothetical protein [Gammaproteobacteria bacterium]